MKTEDQENICLIQQDCKGTTELSSLSVSVRDYDAPMLPFSTAVEPVKVHFLSSVSSKIPSQIS